MIFQKRKVCLIRGIIKKTVLSRIKVTDHKVKGSHTIPRKYSPLYNSFHFFSFPQEMKHWLLLWACIAMPVKNPLKLMRTLMTNPCHKMSFLLLRKVKHIPAYLSSWPGKPQNYLSGHLLIMQGCTLTHTRFNRNVWALQKEIALKNWKLLK